MTTTTALTITPSPSEVTQLTAASGSGDVLVIRYSATTLFEGDHVDVVLPESFSSKTVPMEILDYEDSQGHWTINTKLDDGCGQVLDWTRQGDRCSYELPSTEGSYAMVAVTATNGSSTSRRQTFFIKVKPEGDRPDP